MDSNKVTIQECIDKYEKENKEAIIKNRGNGQTVEFIVREE